jgi:hypothetical protein
MTVALSEVCGKSEEKYFETKYSLAGTVIHVNGTIYFKFKVQLKFRNNNNYSFITVSVHTVYAKKCIDLN